METLYKIETHGTRLCVIVCDHIYPRVAPGIGDGCPPEPYHEHPVFELFLIKSGAIEFRMPEGTVSAEGGVVIIPPHVRHRTVPQDCDAFCLSFTGEPKSERESAAWDALTESIGSSIRFFELKDEQRFYVNRMDAPNLPEDVPHLLTLLFSSLLLPLLPQKNAQTASSLRRTKHIPEVDAFLANHANKKVRLSDLARTLSLSEKQCARFLKKYYGGTLSELVQRNRMESAAVMLRHTALDVGEIAARLGYEYANYFYTVFRKHYGVTPSAYRRGDCPRKKESNA